MGNELSMYPIVNSRDAYTVLALDRAGLQLEEFPIAKAIWCTDRVDPLEVKLLGFFKSYCDDNQQWITMPDSSRLVDPIEVYRDESKVCHIIAVEKLPTCVLFLTLLITSHGVQPYTYLFDCAMLDQEIKAKQIYDRFLKVHERIRSLSDRMNENKENDKQPSVGERSTSVLMKLQYSV